MINLKSRIDETKTFTISSLKEAVQSLDELGLCMNWAVVNELSGLSILFYEGWVYRHSHERFVELPFDEYHSDFGRLFKNLLGDIFWPYIVNNDIHRSIFQVSPHPKEPDCFEVCLVVVFRGKAEIVKTALDDVDDSKEEIKSTVFWLD